MSLLFGILGIGAVIFLLKFLLAVRREPQSTGPRSINIYIAQEQRPGLHKVAARCYGPLTVIDGGRLAHPAARSRVITPLPRLEKGPFHDSPRLA